jgi:hypothetical protein
VKASWLRAEVVLPQPNEIESLCPPIWCNLQVITGNGQWASVAERPVALPPAQGKGSETLTPEQRRALKVLADAGQRGSTLLVLLMAHDFAADLLSGLVLDGLATKSTESPSAGGRTIQVIIFRITDAGREALRMPPLGHAEEQIRISQQIIARSRKLLKRDDKI